MTIKFGYGSTEGTVPVTESLRMSENDMCYEWNEAVIYRHDVTGYYAYYTESGCSCNCLEDDYSEDFFKHNLVWSPNRSPVVLGMSLWIHELGKLSERHDKFDRLQAWIASGR